MKIPLEPVRGMRDLIYPDSEGIEYLKSTFSDLASSYGYELVIPPTIELFSLFAVKSGPEIKKSMYVFEDKAGRQVCLRPEFTAGVARIYLRSFRNKPKPVKIYYVGSAFRYEEPQSGRYREFIQAGVEYIGEPSYYADVELLLLIRDYYRAVGLKDYRVKLGSMGIYRKLFNSWRIPEETQDLIIHYLDKRMLDDALKLIKSSSVEADLKVIEELASFSSEDPQELERYADEVNVKEDIKEEVRSLAKILSILKDLNVPNPYVDLGFARGLAYYTGLIFEIITPALNFSIGGGGRYDGLIALYGGVQTPATGFALGIDRLYLALENLGWEMPKKRLRVGLIALISDLKYVDLTSSRLREVGLSVDVRITTKKKVSDLISDFSSLGYDYVAILGEKEYSSRSVTIKNLKLRTQKTLGIDSIKSGELP